MRANRAMAIALIIERRRSIACEARGGASRIVRILNERAGPVMPQRTQIRRES
jgi:hypothetical protein